MHARATMEKLARHNPAKVIDFLTERLSFERVGVQLYDAVLDRMVGSTDPEVRGMVRTMKEYRDQENAHVDWLVEQIRACGGDPFAESEMSALAARESRGIESVILDGENDISHLFHALLAAELADHAGWELLVAIADEAGDRDAKKQFKKRMHEEETHLRFVQHAVERFACRVVMGYEPVPAARPMV